MSARRAKVTADTFDEKKQTAIEKLTGVSPTQDISAPKPVEKERVRNEAETLTDYPVTEQIVIKGEAKKYEREVKPTSIYFTDAQLHHLDEMAYTYYMRVGKRINRNDIVRYLV